jgi:hypothetical protein
MRRPFRTQLLVGGEPEWRPLVVLARLARESAELPSFHEGEFMYMAAVARPGDRLTLHLYKHRDTRRSLNLDDAGHAYAYCGSVAGVDAVSAGGSYRPHASIADALEHADLSLFDRESMFLRSFPPEAWPSQPARQAWSSIRTRQETCGTGLVDPVRGGAGTVRPRVAGAPGNVDDRA